MSTLFPPLESVSIVRKSNTSTIMTAKASTMSNLPISRLETDASFENNARNNYDLDVLSPELTHNFDTLRSLLKTEPNEDSEHTRAELDVSSTSSNHKRKTAEALAVETALLVEQEVAHLQNGIRELEALLVASQQRQQQQPPTIRSNGRRRTRRRRVVDATNPSFQQQHPQQAADDLHGNQG